MSGQDFEDLIMNLKSSDEKLRKTAISKVSNMNFSKVPKEDLAEIAFYVKEIGDDPNLTIRYFAKKATKRIGEVDDFDALVRQGAETSGTSFQKSLASPPKPVERKVPTITEMHESIEESAPEPVCSECGFLNLTSNKFCSECGAVIGAEGPAAKMKPVEMIKESLPEPMIEDEDDELPIKPVKLPSIPEDDKASKKKYAAAEKKESLPKMKKIKAGSEDSKKEGKLSWFFNFVIYLAALSFCGYTLYEKFNALGAGPLFTKCLYSQVMIGNLALMLVTLFYFRKFWGIKALNKIMYGSVLFTMMFSFYRLPSGDQEALSILGKDSAILMNLFFPITSIIALFIIWGKASGKVIKYYKLVLTILVLYSLAAFVPFFKEFTAPFTDNIISYDNEFLKSTTFLNSYMKPLWIQINVLLPLVLVIILLRSLASFFTFKLKDFIGHLLSLVLILAPCIYGAVLFETGGIKNNVKITEKPLNLWNGVEFLAEKGKLKMIPPSQVAEFILGKPVVGDSKTPENKNDSNTPVKQDEVKTDTPNDAGLDEKNDNTQDSGLNDTGPGDDPGNLEETKAGDENKTDDDPKNTDDSSASLGGDDAGDSAKGLSCKELCLKLQSAYDDYSMDGGEGMKELEISKLSKYLSSYDLDESVKCPDGGQFVVEIEQVKCTKNK